MEKADSATGELSPPDHRDEFAPLVERVRPRLRPLEGYGQLPTRSPYGATESHPALSQAAVALVLRENAGRAELLVIKRAERERDHWSGHLALPGGRREPSDADLVSTAARETSEEVGLLLYDGGEILGGLGVVRPQSPLAPQIEVWPYVAVAPRSYHLPEGGPEPRELALSREVAEAFWLPVAALFERGRSEVFSMIFGGREMRWPAYPSAHGPIWGITERILTDFLGHAS